jgi:hypothetical protein
MNPEINTLDEDHDSQLRGDMSIKLLLYHESSIKFLFRNVKYLSIGGFFRNFFSAIGWLIRFMNEEKDPQYHPEPYENQYFFLLFYWIFIGAAVTRAGYLSRTNANGKGDRYLSRVFLVGEIMTSFCVLIGFFICLTYITIGIDMCSDCFEVFQNSTACFVHQKNCIPSCEAQARSHQSGRKVVLVEFCEQPYFHFYIWWAMVEFVVSLILGVFAIFNAYILEKHLNKLDALNRMAVSQQRFEVAMGAMNIRDTCSATCTMHTDSGHGTPRNTNGSIRPPQISSTMVVPVPSVHYQQQGPMPIAHGVRVR